MAVVSTMNAEQTKNGTVWKPQKSGEMFAKSIYVTNVFINNSSSSSSSHMIILEYYFRATMTATLEWYLWKTQCCAMCGSAVNVITDMHIELRKGSLLIAFFIKINVQKR